MLTIFIIHIKNFQTFHEPSTCITGEIDYRIQQDEDDSMDEDND